MLGYVIVELPSSCKTCENFKTILDNPLVVHYSDGRTEIISGACTCALDDSHRLKPMDNGQVMEQITRPCELGTVHTESKIHSGRPDWCRIKEVFK